MWKQIKLLTGVELRGAFGFNEARYGKDPKKKRRAILLSISFVIIALAILFYIAVMTAGLAAIGMAKAVPAFLCMIISVIILFFTIFKASGIIFNMQTYEKVIVLPVKPAVIVISRFLTVYIFNVLMSLLVLLPGTIVYGIFVKPSFGFYLAMCAGTFLIPLLPITIATALGALVSAVSSRMKHKNFFSIVLSFVVVIGIILGSSLLSAQSENITDSQVAAFSTTVFEQIGKIYPPAILFSNGAVNGNIGDYLLFAGISILVFALFVLLVQRTFVSICTALNAHIAKRNYVMKEQMQSSPLKALYQKELKRYFSSSIYVLNTSIGYIMMVIGAVAVFAAAGKMVNASAQIQLALAVLLGLVASISPTTTSSISIEGKQWWIVKSLPLTAKTVYDSKLLVNMTIALPCYVITEILLCFPLHLSAENRLWMLVIPLLYILFSAVMGLTINIKMPNFSWDSEATAVKQSGAVLVTMLLGFVAAGVPAGLLFLLPVGTWGLIMAATAVVLAALTILLYRVNNKVALKTIN